MGRMKLEPGDWICWTGTIREIVDVRDTGYGWRYPDIGGLPNAIGENYFWSENSCDPFFEFCWTLVTPDDTTAKLK